MVGGGEVAAHQSSRNEGDVSGIAIISGGGRRSSCDLDVRQLDGYGVRQQAGRDGLPLPLLIGESASEVDGESRHLPRCEVSSRAVQCSGRSPQPSGSGYRDRVVSPPADGKGPSSSLGFAVDRSVRNEPQREAPPILFPCPGSPGRLRGHVSSPLGRPGRVRVSTLSSRRKGGGSGQRDSQSLHASGRPPLAGGVGRQPSSSTDPSTSGTAVVGPVVAAAPLPPVPQRRPHAEPSRAPTRQYILRKSGFSRGSAIEMSGCVRTSTSQLYQAKRMLFCGWCRGKGVATVNATLPLIVDFLIHLRRDKSLSVSAIKGCRAALNSVFVLKGMDLADSRPISMLIRSFSKSVRPEKLRPPAWDVAFVLQSLTQAPYELLQTADEHFLAQKTLFLLALASAKRVGELQALSYRVSHSRAWGEVSFTFVAGFVAKTQDPSSSAPRFEGFSVPSLPNSSTNCNGSLLCVRAVRCYLDRTAAHRPRCERLFVTAGRIKKEISKNTVSFWLQQTISQAYQLSGRSVPDPPPRTRETRGIAPSLLFKKNFTVSLVLKAGTWHKHTTFTRHYLRDLAHRSLATFHLGPVVTAQALV